MTGTVGTGIRSFTGVSVEEDKAASPKRWRMVIVPRFGRMARDGDDTLGYALVDSNRHVQRDRS